MTTRAKTALAYLWLTLGIALQGCVTRITEHEIEVTGPDSLEHKLRRAQAIVTEDRFARLKQQIRERMPSVTDADVERLGLRWNIKRYTSYKDLSKRDYVTVSIVVRTNGGFDPTPLMETAIKIMEPEVNPVSGESPNIDPSAGKI